MNDTKAPEKRKPDPLLGVGSSEGLGPAVPQEVMTYLHAYGDSRADDDGLSAMRIGEAVLALRRWSAEVQAAERERCAKLCEQMMDDSYTEVHLGGEPADALDCAAAIRRV